MNFPKKSLFINVLAMSFCFFIFIIFLNKLKHQNLELVSYSQLTKNIGQITYYDEVLTMSCWMAAMTGDLKWKDRYDQYVKKLEVSLSSYDQKHHGELNDKNHQYYHLKTFQNEEKENIKKIDQANNILVDLETKAFEFINNKQLKNAQDILNSQLYKENKKIYLEGYQNIFDLLNREIELSLNSHNDQYQFYAWLLVFLIGAVLVSLIQMTKVLVKWFRTIIHQTESLEKLNRSLDHQVESNTLKVKKTYAELTRNVQKIKSVVEMSSDAFIGINHLSQVIEWNQSAEKIFQWSREEIIYQSLDKIIPKEFRESHHQGMKTYLESGSGPILGKRIEIMAIKKNQEMIPVDLTVWPVKTEGEIQFYAFLRDISERVENQKKLEISKQKIQNILDHASDAIISISDTFNIILFNKKAEKLFGYKADEMLNQDINLLLPKSKRFDHHEKIKLFVESQMPNLLSENRTSFIGLAKDGREFPVEISISKMTTDQKIILTAVVRDISKRIENEEKQKYLQDQLFQAQKLESIGTLAAGIAHEINTPVQFINDNLIFLNKTIKKFLDFNLELNQSIENGSNDLLKNKIQKMEQQYKFDYLKKEIPLSIDQSIEGVQRVSNIVKAMKDFSYQGSKQDKEKANINQAIESTVIITKNEWKYIADIDLKLDQSIPEVLCFIGDLKQVILNMIVNAAQAIAEKKERENVSDKGHITIETKLKNDLIQILIQDDGGGIPSENIQKIFDPFFTTKPLGKGTGQGLAISYHIIKEKHQGTIQVQSEMNIGTSFIIEFPVNR